jgi:hypothetical protein
VEGKVATNIEVMPWKHLSHPMNTSIPGRRLLGPWEHFTPVPGIKKEVEPLQSFSF